jgi:hypothetical protein
MIEPLTRITCNDDHTLYNRPGEGEFLYYDEVVELVEKACKTYLEHDGTPGESHFRAMDVIRQGLGLK